MVTRRNHWLACGHGLAALSLLGTIFAVAGCSSDKSFAVVTVRTTEAELNNVAQFEVFVSNGATLSQPLFYPPVPDTDPTNPTKYRLTTTETVDFSVSFNDSYTGVLKVGVEPRDAVGTPLAYGEATKMIDPGHRFDIDVPVTIGARAPASREGAPPDAPPLVDGAGADGGPIPLACDPTNPAGTCATGETCTVNCLSAAPVGRCAVAGAGVEGTACQANDECAPGTQCFRYACGGVCHKFCKTDADCPTGGTCTRTVSCGTLNTGHKFCAMPCDPRGAATGGCNGGLRCLLFAMESTICDCPDAARAATDGQPCEDTSKCAPGLICVQMGTPTPLCRPICKLSDHDCEAGRTCTELLSPKYVTWGACVPPVSMP